MRPLVKRIVFQLRKTERQAYAQETRIYLKYIASANQPSDYIFVPSTRCRYLHYLSVVQSGTRIADKQKCIIKMYFPLIGYNLPADYSRISVNFFLYQYLLDVATVSSSTLLKFTTHFRNNTATHVFQIQQLNKFNFHLNLLRCFSCELLLCQETSRKKSQEFRLGLRGDQNLPQL